jgi:hypothetical protein
MPISLMVLFLCSFDPFQGFVTSRQIFVRGGHHYVRRSDEGSGFDLFDEREDFEEAGVEGALAAEKEVWLFEPGLRALLVV